MKRAAATTIACNRTISSGRCSSSSRRRRKRVSWTMGIHGWITVKYASRISSSVSGGGSFVASFARWPSWLASSIFGFPQLSTLLRFRDLPCPWAASAPPLAAPTLSLGDAKDAGVEAGRFGGPDGGEMWWCGTAALEFWTRPRSSWMRLENAPTTSCVDGALAGPWRASCVGLSKTAFSSDSFHPPPSSSVVFVSRRQGGNHLPTLLLSASIAPGLTPGLLFFASYTQGESGTCQWQKLPNARCRVTHSVSGSVCRSACPASSGASAAGSPDTTAGPGPAERRQDRHPASPYRAVLLARELSSRSFVVPEARRMVRCPCGENSTGIPRPKKRRKCGGFCLLARGLPLGGLAPHWRGQTGISLFAGVGLC